MIINNVVAMVVQDLQVHVHSVPITTKVVCSNHAHGEIYSILHYVIKFISDLQQVGDFLRIFRFSPPINWLSRYNWNIVESCVKYHSPNPINNVRNSCLNDRILYGLFNCQYTMLYLNANTQCFISTPIYHALF
jgi:hypothetical protein